MDALISLGRNVFYTPSLGTDALGFEAVVEEFAGGWVSQGRLSRDPAMQFTGPGPQSFNIAGRAYPKLFGGLSTIETLKQDIRAGKPLSLIRYSNGQDNNSKVVTGTVSSNKYVIMKLVRSEQKIGSDGTPNRVDFSLELMLYGDDVNTGGPLASFL
jgi:phage protein U